MQRSPVLAFGLMASAAAAQCEPVWLQGYSHTASPFNGVIEALRTWERPGGPPVLAVSSSFPVPKMAPVKLALFDGEQWIPLPPGPRIFPAALEVYGGDLIAAGFANTPTGPTIARWTGTEWLTLGAGVDGPVRALAVHDGSLYAGGEFNHAGGLPAARLARWDGERWHDVGGGIAGPFFPMVFSLHSAPGGLLVGGFFAQAGGTPAGHIARWDGEQWSAFGEGRPGMVECIAVYQGEIIAGGQAPAGEQTIARWDGQSWLPLGAGVNQTVRALHVQDDTLYAAGFFTSAGGLPANRIARWDGRDWSAMGEGLIYTSINGGHVNALEPFGNAIAAGGFFDTAGGRPSLFLARWGCDGCYANCDGSTQEPALNVADFTCFLQRFAAAEPYANCDNSTAQPTLNVADFTCFLQSFAAGCP